MKRVALILAIAAPVAALAAQAKVEIIPTLGLYLPSGNVADQYGAGCSCQVTANQEQAFLLGVRVTIWATRNLGLETSAATIGSGVHLIAQGVESGDTTGTVNILSERVVWTFLRPSSSAGFYAAGGISYISHSSPAYEGLTGLSNIAGSAGLGVRLFLGSSMTFKAEGEDYVYTTQFELPNAQKLDAKHQNDIVISLGLAIGL